MTPDFTDTITLGDDPFSAEYWANHRVAPLLEAMRDIMADEPDYAKYIDYWHTRCKGDDTEAIRIGECYRKMGIRIKANGYERNAWQGDGRDFDVTQGHGPMSVEIGPDGKLWPIDGSHRACILRLLGEPVTMWVWRRRPEWEKLKAFHKTLYTPYPHPDFAEHPVTRRGDERLFAGIHKIHRRNVDSYGVCIVGACTGFSSAIAAAWVALGPINNGTVTAIEPCPERLALLSSVVNRPPSQQMYGIGLDDGRLRPMPLAEIIPCADYAHEHDYSGYDAVLGYSVYQHVATTWHRWAAVTARLAKCPMHILELPGNGEHQWHDEFRKTTDNLPRQAIINMLRNAGDYGPPEVIYTDRTYANRQTILLQRT